MTQKTQSVLTPEVKAMMGKTGDKVASWGVVDEEYLRRFAQAVPDWDPRFWDEEFAKTTRFKARTVPPLMCTYMSGRRPLSEKDRMDEVMEQNPKSDGGGGMRTEKGALPRMPWPRGLNRHLHGGDEVEVFQYPKMGDKISFQRKYLDAQERVGGDGKAFLVVTSEATYWNQKNEVLCKVRTIAVQR
jgi:hypothetical protein